MYISRVLIRNFRNFCHVDVPLQPGVTCIVGENNSGKTNFITALRIATDPALSYQSRRLEFRDFPSAVDASKPQQILICVEFRDYTGKPNEEAMVGRWSLDGTTARLIFRFRPSRVVREAILAGDRQPEGLTPEDYRSEFCGGGPGDPATASWSDSLGASVDFNDLQQFLVTVLLPLRDVEHSLRQARLSPLGRLIDASAIPEGEKVALTGLLAAANKQIAESPTIKKIGTDVSSAFTETAGAFSIKVALGMSAPDFGSIARGLTPLLTTRSIENVDPSRNGLGLNNVLFIVLLLLSFELRLHEAKGPGQLLLIEEPEAHLHPQLQRVLFASLHGKPFQVVVTTHSTHVTSQAPLNSTIILTDLGAAGTVASCPSAVSVLTAHETADLERYLDATRATLLYARRVMLVEGPAELFLIPALVRQVMGIDLEQQGVSVIPIFGVHFGAYGKLFGPEAMRKRCAIVADGDLTPSDSFGVEGDDLPDPVAPALEGLQNDFVKIFKCSTTFERVITMPGTLSMLIATLKDLGGARAAERLLAIQEAWTEDASPEADEARTLVLRSATRLGKARFAQVAARHAGAATSLPKYIRTAVEWLTTD